MDALAKAAARLLQARGLTLVTAESCTGGWLAKAVTDMAGSSGWFDRGFVTYSNDAKIESLGVGAQMLQTHGAVSKQSAREMAIGALNHSRADIAVAITGIAGPEGGTPDKPVGTVWIAWGRRGGDMATTHYQFEGDRERVRLQSVVAALEGVIAFVE